MANGSPAHPAAGELSLPQLARLILNLAGPGTLIPKELDAIRGGPCLNWAPAQAIRAQYIYDPSSGAGWCRSTACTSGEPSANRHRWRSPSASGNTVCASIGYRNLFHSAHRRISLPGRNCSCVQLPPPVEGSGVIFAVMMTSLHPGSGHGGSSSKTLPTFQVPGYYWS